MFTMCLWSPTIVNLFEGGKLCHFVKLIRGERKQEDFGRTRMRVKHGKASLIYPWLGKKLERYSITELIIIGDYF